MKALNEDIDRQKREYIKLENELKALSAENKSNIERGDKWKSKHKE